jgi:hypothetical protein
VAWSLPRADGVGMSETSIHAGTRSNSFGTWALATFILLFLPGLALGPLAPFAPLVYGVYVVIPGAICAAATFGAVVCGLVGLVSTESYERRAAAQGLLKATPAALMGTWYALLLWSLLGSDWTLG